MGAFKSLLEELASKISEASGFSISAHDLQPGMNNSYSFRILEYHSPIGFELLVERSPLSWRIYTQQDSFAGKLLAIFSENFYESRDEFTQVISDVSAECTKVDFVVNQKNITELENGESWDSFSLKVNVPLYRSDEIEFKDEEEMVNSLTRAMTLSLVPFLVLSGDKELSNPEGYFDVEGEVSQGYFNKYERSRRNRKLCLLHFGYRCQACSLLLEEKYGAPGREFIHVHHSIPVSQMEMPGEVNPFTDLVPLCPNCHYIAHRSSPPLTLDELIKLIEINQQAN